MMRTQSRSPLFLKQKPPGQLQLTKRNARRNLARPAGLEPATYGLEVRKGVFY